MTMGSDMDWDNVRAPSLADFERIADEAFARLPESFRARCEGLIIRVEDFPDDEIAAEMELESPSSCSVSIRAFPMSSAR